MTQLEQFHLYAGETLMECQRIEHDVKLMYAGMKNGDFNRNIAEVKIQPLGTVLIDLQALDNSDGRPSLAEEDYALLREIKNVRNWLAHKAYLDFMYASGEALNRNFERSFARLSEFRLRIKRLGDVVEKVRLEILKKYGRI